MDNNLKHVGVTGMRWGQRKNSSTLAQLREKNLNLASKNRQEARRLKHPGKKGEKSSDDFKKVVELRKKKINELSNEDLDKVIKRMDLQKRYKDLNPSKADKGKKAAGNVMSSIGKVAGTAASILTLASIGNALYKKINAYRSVG